MKPIFEVKAFIVESDSSELPKKVVEAIEKMGRLWNWRISEYYFWKVEQPTGKDNTGAFSELSDALNTYLLNNGAKLNSYVFIHF